MNEELSGAEQLLLTLLRCSLTGAEPVSVPADEFERVELLKIAEVHSVTSLLYPVWDSPETARAAEICTRQYYHLLMATRYAVTLLEKAGIASLVLKGPTAAAFYPVPEYRKSGDVDLLLDRSQLAAACAVMENAGAKRANVQHANHHVVFRMPDGIDLELHVSMTEDFGDRKTNRYLRQLQDTMAEKVETREIMGVPLPVLPDGLQAFHLLLHMLQHYLRAGFGLKLLCDWVALWNHGISPEQTDDYLRMIGDCGLTGFSAAITELCCRCLGLDAGRVRALLPTDEGPEREALCTALLREILEAEEFGRSSADRMVVLHGNAAHDFLREFHHQMLLNYPRAGRFPLIWPALWLVTLLRFLFNNRQLRGVSLWRVLKTAGERSRLSQQMRLFRR